MVLIFFTNSPFVYNGLDFLSMCGNEHKSWLPSAGRAYGYVTKLVNSAFAVMIPGHGDLDRAHSLLFLRVTQIQ